MPTGPVERADALPAATDRAPRNVTQSSKDKET